MASFIGDLEELKALVAQCGIKGAWTVGENGHHQYRTQDRAQLNWWSTSGTITYTGKAEPKTRLEAALTTVLAAPAPIPAHPVAPPKAARIIFVVHGHDIAARDQLELALHRLDLEPFILMNTSGEGQTLIEALEGRIGRDYSSDFGIVLMTPDDLGAAKAEHPEKAEPRARQNVILETGMVLASLTRKRMALLVKGHVELPSDLEGIIRFHFNDHVREILPKLCGRLREAGIAVDMTKIGAASA
jgi:predicted nucleotide-binding protein